MIEWTEEQKKNIVSIEPIKNRSHLGTPKTNDENRLLTEISRHKAETTCMLYQKGITINEISERLKISERYVYAILRKNNIKTGKHIRSWTDKEVCQLTKMKMDGQSNYDISIVLNRSLSSIKAKCSKLSI